LHIMEPNSTKNSSVRLRILGWTDLLRPLLFAATLALLFPLPCRGDTTELEAIAQGLEAVTAQVSPAVVQIFASGYHATVGVGATAAGLIAKQRGSGSGVIVDPTGYIVTNNHVVTGASRIRVVMARPVVGPKKPRSILRGGGILREAVVVGRDVETDLAVLKIESESEPFPFLEFADSDEVRPGNLALAIGSPFGLENSVTLGIVSSTARQLRPDDPMIYIQTDATINPGNSGGPLVDVKGRIVGISTMIFSKSGGSDGIGFAAPSNIVQSIYRQIRKSGRVIRGTVGIEVQTISPVMARGLDLPRPWGAIISDVALGAPAYQAGLKPGDVIKSLNGKSIENARQFEVNLYQLEAGDFARIDVVRGQMDLEFRVDVVERRDTESELAGLVSPERNLIPQLGVLALDIDSTILRVLPSMRRKTGVLIAARGANAPGEDGDVSFLPGDILYSINGTDIVSVASLQSMLATFAAGDAIVAQVENAGELRFVPLELE